VFGFFAVAAMRLRRRRGGGLPAVAQSRSRAVAQSRSGYRDQE